MTPIEDGPVLFSVVNGVAHLVLNRPQAANSIDLHMADALVDVVDRCTQDQVQVVVVSGSGDRFCAGGDLRSFMAAPNPSACIEEVANKAGAAMQALGRLPVPVVAAVQGAVAGAGLGFALNADIVVANPGTRFTMAYSEVGLTPDCGVTYLLPRVIGLRAALDFTLQRQVINAATALEMGLITTIAQQDAADEALRAARELTNGPARALGVARRLLRDSYNTSTDHHRADEIAAIAAAISQPDTVTRIARFFDR